MTEAEWAEAVRGLGFALGFSLLAVAGFCWSCIAMYWHDGSWFAGFAVWGLGGATSARAWFKLGVHRGKQVTP